MSILAGLCRTAKRDFLLGVHQPGDRYKIALYGPNAHLNPLVETYTTEGEVVGQGYERGGRPLRGYRCELDGATAVLGWTDTVAWPNATISAAGALVYNASKQNKALVVISFDGLVVSTNGPWEAPMPPCTATAGLIRIM